MAFGFCVVNSILQNRSIIYFMDLQNFNDNIHTSILGICLFFLGIYINISHDYYLLNKKIMKKNILFQNSFYLNIFPAQIISENLSNGLDLQF